MSQPTDMKSIAQCSNCQFWCRDEEPYSEALDVKRCKYAVFAEYATKWNEDYDRVLKPEFQSVKAFVMDGSGYRAVFYTTSDFGCNQHKEQE